VLTVLSHIVLAVLTCVMAGQVQRQLFHRGMCTAQDAAQTLLSVIHTSLANEHDFRLPRLLAVYLSYFTDVWIIQPSGTPEEETHPWGWLPVDTYVGWNSKSQLSQ